jgi:hypothetical protein
MNCAKAIFELMLDIMKKQLKLAEFGFGGKTKADGTPNDAFVYFKEQTMNHFYDTTKKFFQQGVTDGYFEHCTCGNSIRRGHKECPDCGGGGFRDKKEEE